MTAPNQLPATGYVRLSQIIGNKKTNPPTPGIIPVSKSTWFKMQAEGRAPKPVKFGPRISAYPVDAIRAMIVSGLPEEAAHVA